jgi:hypothetical protein
MGKNRIPDKHPGSATLLFSPSFQLKIIVVEDPGPRPFKLNYLASREFTLFGVNVEDFERVVNDVL